VRTTHEQVVYERHVGGEVTERVSVIVGSREWRRLLASPEWRPEGAALSAAEAAEPVLVEQPAPVEEEPQPKEEPAAPEPAPPEPPRRRRR
jgi:hypothetical protein